MIQGHYDPLTDRRTIYIAQRRSLLQCHPVMMPVVLIGSSITLFVVSFFANTLFPLLALIGAPSTLICVLLALVLGLCGILASIISIIEKIDRSRLQTIMVRQPSPTLSPGQRLIHPSNDALRLALRPQEGCKEKEGA